MEGLLLAFMFVVFFVIVVLGYVYNTFLRFNQKRGNEFLEIFIMIMAYLGLQYGGDLRLLKIGRMFFIAFLGLSLLLL